MNTASRCMLTFQVQQLRLQESAFSRNATTPHSSSGGDGTTASNSESDENANSDASATPQQRTLLSDEKLQQHRSTEGEVRQLEEV